MQKVIGIQCRSNSVRLPNKFALMYHGKSLLEHIVYTSKKVTDKVVVLTARDDYRVINECKRINVDYFTGSLDNVFDRYYQYLKQINELTGIIRLTADCPFIYLPLLHYMYHQIDGTVDFYSNAHPRARTTPDGWDIEYISFRLLKKVSEMQLSAEDKEHVTKYIYDNQVRLECDGYVYDYYLDNFDYSKLKFSMDTTEDKKRLIKQ